MLSKTKNFIIAISTLIGTIVGVGMFGLPYVASRVGLVPMAINMVLVGSVVILLHLMYGEIVLRTNGKHRLVGYAQIYFGSIGKFFATIIFFFTLYLALLAYLLVGSEFLREFFSGWIDLSNGGWAVVIAVFGYLMIFKGIKTSGYFEVLMTLVLLSLILGITVYGADKINTSNFISFSGNIDWFLPYGVILFSLAGGSAIPEIRSIFSGSSAKLLKKTIIFGTIIPAVIYLIFSATVLGISGPNTSREAVSGLLPFLGGDFVKYGAMVGFLAVITSFFTVGLAIKNSFIFDFGLSKITALILTVLVPLSLYFFGFSDFIKIFSVAGAILGGCEALLLLAIWSKARRKGRRVPEYSVNLERIFVFILSAAFLAGIVYEFIYIT
jgi:tyrosine-specific transport protein